MRHSFNLLIAGVLLVVSTSCAGRGPNPILVNRATDSSLDCGQIRAEIAGNQGLIQNLQIEDSDITSENIIMGIAGAFLLIPWFFLDLKTSPSIRQEITALQQRNTRLQQFAYRQKCDLLG